MKSEIKKLGQDAFSELENFDPIEFIKNKDDWSKKKKIEYCASVEMQI